MYLKAKISYDHDIRVEDYPFAREAVREAIYNAIAHNCYMYGTPIQIKIMEDEMTISNRCILPENWTVETLMGKHDSIPYNPEIANVFIVLDLLKIGDREFKKSVMDVRK